MPSIIGHPTVRVSPKFQVVIPRSVREAAGVRPGTEYAVVATDSGLHFVRIRPLEALRGRFTRKPELPSRDKRDRLSAP